LEVDVLVFDEWVAGNLLEEIRNGATLTTACNRKSMPSRGVVYGWLRDPEAKIGKKTFRTCFSEAEDDRRMTWRDMAILSITQLEGRDKDELNFAMKKSQLLMAASKESGIEIISRGADVPLVILRKFLPDEE
jgi:hypothetical protein